MSVKNVALFCLLWFCLSPQLCQGRELKLPYHRFGLDDRQAALHLLSRFSFGPKPGEIDEMVAMGLGKWLEQQLAATLPEEELDKKLEAYPTLRLSDRETSLHYLIGLDTLAIRSGAVPAPAGDASQEERKQFREAVMKWAQEQGYHDANELRPELLDQKLVRAVYSKNQLWEVMTDFWFNHFNVSFLTAARTHVLSYERDAIRPRALGQFLPLLMATAKHPAMLAYLSNAQSVANADEPTTSEFARHQINRRRRSSKAGLNENYGREVMELHTLGVDGGYTQQDVTQVARALTGWTIYPMGPQPQMEKVRENLAQQRMRGAVVQGDFLFRADQHDAGPKTILGRQFPAGGGLGEGEAVLRMLAQHPSTAHFISRKLAVRFVSDAPPEKLVQHLAGVFRRSGGDTREMIRAIVESPEFWSPEARGAKVKSPFELVASSMRALNSDVEPTPACFYWIERMGQALYAYAPPTGFPDRADAWINSGTLTYRMNYSLNLAAGRIRGVKVDLSPLESDVKQSAELELERVAHMLLAGHDVERTIRDLRPLVVDPEFPRKIEEAHRRKAGAMDKAPVPQAPLKKPPQLSQVVGILIGSPEFQRR